MHGAVLLAAPLYRGAEVGRRHVLERSRLVWVLLGVGLGLGLGLGLGFGLGLGMGVGVGARVGFGLRLGVGFGLGFGSVSALYDFSPEQIPTD